MYEGRAFSVAGPTLWNLFNFICLFVEEITMELKKNLNILRVALKTIGVQTVLKQRSECVQTVLRKCPISVQKVSKHYSESVRSVQTVFRKCPDNLQTVLI